MLTFVYCTDLYYIFVTCAYNLLKKSRFFAFLLDNYLFLMLKAVENNASDNLYIYSNKIELNLINRIKHNEIQLKQ